MPFMPVQIFTIFQHLRYRYPMVTFGMIAKWKTSTAGVERCQLDTCNTKKEYAGYYLCKRTKQKPPRGWTWRLMEKRVFFICYTFNC